MGKFRRRSIKQHKEFLENPYFQTRKEKHIKVRKREQEEKDSKDQIKEFVRDS